MSYGCFRERVNIAFNKLIFLVFVLVDSIFFLPLNMPHFFLYSTWIILGDLSSGNSKIKCSTFMVTKETHDTCLNY